jgi:hypothetical protein
MSKILLLLSWSGLFLTIIPSMFVFLGMVDGGELKLFMLVGAVFWFAGRVPATWKS